jgi:hypothetical protein
LYFAVKRLTPALGVGRQSLDARCLADDPLAVEYEQSGDGRVLDDARAYARADASEDRAAPAQRIDQREDLGRPSGRSSPKVMGEGKWVR